jgi:hypothetical protein
MKLNSPLIWLRRQKIFSTGIAIIILNHVGGYRHASTTLLRKNPHYLKQMTMGGLQRRSGLVRKIGNLLPLAGFELRTVQFLGCRCDWQRYPPKLSVQWNQRDALFIQFIENQGTLHVSSITCSSSGCATQTAFGILRAYNVSWLWHGCSEAVHVEALDSQ